ncbi:hypothetical protein [Pseudomonas sp. P7548]|uniref:hypothetical protein n=1 Tax=Pseudomonas sp. P7548 TaxID=2726981 RepID=UPI0015C09C79|nr:hypothetical protein [Pseudomonas sp. P7548]NWE18057.1 hypothetical protein [Pseudomonas sp. P7548]
MPSALGKSSTSWREQSFWTKAWTYTLLPLIVVFTSHAGTWPDGSSSNRKRVFSPGFILLCVFVAVIELMALSHYHDAYG